MFLIGIFETGYYLRRVDNNSLYSLRSVGRFVNDKRFLSNIRGVDFSGAESRGALSVLQELFLQA